MSLLEAVILGVVQGLTEFLPISSSGHLVMTEYLLGISMPGVLLEVVLHVGTLLSVVIVYRGRLLGLTRGALTGDRTAWRYILLLGLATVPAGLVGLFLKDPIETAFDTPAVTGFMLLVTGLLLYSTRWAARGRGAATGEPDAAAEVEGAEATALHASPVGIGVATAMGLAQAFAILPGISRSGTTITTGLWGKVDAVRAAEFSFLMSIPAIAGAAVLQVGDVHEVTAGALPLAVGFLAALLSGIVAIRSLVWLLRRQGFHRFAYYVWLVGALFLGLLWLR